MKEYKYKINGVEYTVVINKVEDGNAELEVNGTPYNVEMITDKKKPAIKKPVVQRPVMASASTTKVVPSAPASGGSANGIKAPLPGVILDIVVSVGDTVKRGQKVAVLEAMKMENNINAESDGVVKEIKVKKGDAILEGTDIIVIG
jgi:biotin carboxyl carrier protein